MSTWWHPRYGSGHAIDHVLIRDADAWHATRCAAVHPERGFDKRCAARGRRRRDRVETSGPSWDNYTDHHPMELSVRTGKLWVPTESVNVQTRLEPQVNLDKMRDSSESAKDSVRDWNAKVESDIREVQETREVEWVDIVNMCVKHGRQCFGVKPSRKGRPWLQDNVENLRVLDSAVTAARTEYRRARAQPRPWSAEGTTAVSHARRALAAANKARRKTILTWEWKWWDKVAAEAKDAHEAGDSRGVFAAHRKLGAREEHRRKEVAFKTADNPEEEREAWKLHFERIQAGREEVADVV